MGQDPFLTFPPLIAANGDSYVGLVQLPDRTDVWFSNALQQVTLPTPVLGQVALAGNGSDVLVVWSSPHPTGLVVHPDGLLSVPFPIATLGYQPKVVSINSTEFVVLYRNDLEDRRSVIRGRIVQLPAAKRRGAR